MATRRAWRPPSNSASSQASTICSARPGPTTSVNRNVDAVGAAVEALLALMDDRPAQDVTVPFSIVERESTG